MKSLVSVVIPHYNRPKLLRRAIDSVLLQGDVIGEIIVVDDHSNPEEFAAVEKFAKLDARLQILRMESNSGANVARNFGMSMAKSRWVALLDSDDEWMPDKCIEQIRWMEAHSLDMSCTQFIEVDASGRSVIRPSSPFSADCAAYLFSEQGHFQTSTMMMRSDVAPKFDASIRRYQDWHYVIATEARGLSLGVLMMPLTIYHSDHILRMSAAKRSAALFEFYQKVCPLISSIAQSAFFSQIAPRTLAREGRIREAIQIFLSGECSQTRRRRVRDVVELLCACKSGVVDRIRLLR